MINSLILCQLFTRKIVEVKHFMDMSRMFFPHNVYVNNTFFAYKNIAHKSFLSKSTFIQLCIVRVNIIFKVDSSQTFPERSSKE